MSWVDALEAGREDDAVRLFLEEWHDWTPDDTDERAPRPLSYFGPKLRRRASFQNTFLVEEHEEGLIFYRENQANYEVLLRVPENELVYLDGAIFSDPIELTDSLAHFLLKCVVYETAFGAGTKGAWGCGARDEYDPIIERLRELHSLTFWICGYGRTRFFTGDGVVAYSATDVSGTDFCIGARDPNQLMWLKRFEKLSWESFEF